MIEIKVSEIFLLKLWACSGISQFTMLGMTSEAIEKVKNISRKIEKSIDSDEDIKLIDDRVKDE